ncbi:hypothetical protein [Eilatimonas milleporae]|uniref:Uncharacterized protein n=1 Tax=Eilatimonas milleporae TaxID=911205 RepID=A0A3M0CHE4_9PROT|nr:hypothetical protein [Eilatimonas milleporae]RMB09041.1 hypothetical protein BXY39_1689 [Eilatimonas milleporae]
MARRKSVSLSDLQAQKQALTEAIEAKEQELAVSYGMPFVRAMGDDLDVRDLAKLASAVGAIGLGQALTRLTPRPTQKPPHKPGQG